MFHAQSANNQEEKSIPQLIHENMEEIYNEESLRP